MGKIRTINFNEFMDKVSEKHYPLNLINSLNEKSIDEIKEIALAHSFEYFIAIRSLSRNMDKKNVQCQLSIINYISKIAHNLPDINNDSDFLRGKVMGSVDFMFGFIHAVEHYKDSNIELINYLKRIRSSFESILQHYE